MVSKPSQDAELYPLDQTELEVVPYNTLRSVSGKVLTAVLIKDTRPTWLAYHVDGGTYLLWNTGTCTLSLRHHTQDDQKLPLSIYFSAISHTAFAEPIKLYIE